MDFLGWTMLGALVLGVLALYFFGARFEARRTAAARAWASAAGLRELPSADRAFVAFTGTLRDAPLTVTQARGYSRGHYVWSLRTKGTSLPPLYVVSRFEEALSQPWRRVESAHPELRARGWLQVNTGDPGFDAKVIVWSATPDGASWLEPALRSRRIETPRAKKLSPLERLRATTAARAPPSAWCARRALRRRSRRWR